MSRSFDKLATLLKELFQLDRPDLDFGFYRIMHAKSAEVTQFLEQDLLPQVQAALSQYQSADKAAIEKELDQTVRRIRSDGADPDTSPKVRELRTRLAEEAVDLEALEAEVYDHLYAFFRRYYSEGDFLSKRVYKPGVYAIPYEGEEVKLHWANADQYYIKTSEYLRDYAFRLRPDDAEDSHAGPFPPRGCRGGRTRKRQGSRRKEPGVPASGNGFHRRGGRRTGERAEGAGHPLRVPSGDARRLAGKGAKGKEQAAGAEGPDRAGRTTGAGGKGARTRSLDRSAETAPRHRGRRAG